MRNSGLIDYWINHFIKVKFGQHYLRDHSSHSQFPQDNTDNLTLNHMFYSFKAHFNGILLCITLFAVEMSFSLIYLKSRFYYYSIKL